MTIIHLLGEVNKQGKLEVELPEGLPQSKVKITLELLSEKNPTTQGEQAWTDEELEALLKTEPKTNAEIAEWLLNEASTGWEDIGVTGEEWVEAQRRKHRERSQW